MSLEYDYWQQIFSSFEVTVTLGAPKPIGVAMSASYGLVFDRSRRGPRRTEGSKRSEASRLVGRPGGDRLT